MLRSRRRQRIVVRCAAIFLAAVSLSLLLLPPDSAITLAVRLGTHNFLSNFPSLYNHDDWLYQPPQFPVDIQQDLATILKTGYGTWTRLPAQLEAFGWTLNETDGQAQSVMVVGDYSSRFQTDRHEFSVHDMLAAAEESQALIGMQHGGRFEIYRRMIDAIQSGEEDLAQQLNKKHGWELDAMKFIPALERAWRVLPRKKWYLMLDDDTYVLWPSLKLLLGHLDSSKPFYMGNAVGDYKRRFAHGGSAIVISAEAMRRLFDGRSDVVRAAYVDSLTETWGDRLLAQALIRVGVYIEERYSRFFNGERPRKTRITAESFCGPLISFHALARPDQMLEVGGKFRDMTAPAFWSELWQLYGQPEFATLLDKDYVIGEGADHVGQLDERTTTKKGVSSAQKCSRKCRSSRSCLAWRWEKTTYNCHLAPWFIIGGEEDIARQGVKVSSGLNIRRVAKLQERCQRPDASERVEHHRVSWAV